MVAWTLERRRDLTASPDTRAPEARVHDRGVVVIAAIAAGLAWFAALTSLPLVVRVAIATAGTAVLIGSLVRPARDK
jgi:hypothetical protein